MAYLTIAQLEARKDAREVAELSNDENGTTRVDANVEAAIDDASSAIDEALADRMDVPVPVPDGVIRRICADLAIYYLAARRPGDIPERFQSLYDKSMEALARYGIREEGVQPPFASRDDDEEPFPEE